MLATVTVFLTVDSQPCHYRTTYPDELVSVGSVCSGDDCLDISIVHASMTKLFSLFAGGRMTPVTTTMSRRKQESNESVIGAFIPLMKEDLPTSRWHVECCTKQFIPLESDAVIIARLKYSA